MASSGFFSSLRDLVRMPGAQGTVEHRVRQFAAESIERPKPDACPRCNGPLTPLTVLGETRAGPDRRGMLRERTFCQECGVEEEWHQLIRAVGR
ncbi:MAG TPA: hypothetical protein VD970_04170 [Acetobacteraceae bacterium]|nr:hypothetical protein [Acetobacteraceae bacterium]